MMIAVIADDMTGAAELGGIGIRYGLDVEIQTDFITSSEADLLVIDTNTRSTTPEEAASKIKTVVKDLKKTDFEWLYKKIDSVMRGHVLVELENLLIGLNKKRALLVPANPSAIRFITAGIYFVRGQLLHRSEFAFDPEYPATSSEVLDLLGHSDVFETSVIESSQALPPKGIAIGEAVNEKDMRNWASKLNEQVIPAGAADFFETVLESKGFREKKHKSFAEVLKDKTALFVLGSASIERVQVAHELKRSGIPLCALPCKFVARDNVTHECLDKWIEKTLTKFAKKKQVAVAIYKPVVRRAGLAQKLADFTARLVEEVLQKVSVEELIIEGGATASTVLRRLKWKSFTPVQELAPGVVRMKVKENNHPFVTLKPGSYHWPEELILNQNYS